MKLSKEFLEIRPKLRWQNFIIQLCRKFFLLKMSQKVTLKTRREQARDADSNWKKLGGRLCKAFGIVGRSEKKLRNMESQEEQQALDCMTRHIRTFLLQSSEGRTADYGEPCENCEKLKECNFDWLSIMDPLLERSKVKINMVI